MKFVYVKANSQEWPIQSQNALLLFISDIVYSTDSTNYHLKCQFNTLRAKQIIGHVHETLAARLQTQKQQKVFFGDNFSMLSHFLIKIGPEMYHGTPTGLK